MKATDTLTYDENEIRRIAVKAFDIAMKRDVYKRQVLLIAAADLRQRAD